MASATGSIAGRCRLQIRTEASVVHAAARLGGGGDSFFDLSATIASQGVDAEKRLAFRRI